MRSGYFESSLWLRGHARKRHILLPGFLLLGLLSFACTPPGAVHPAMPTGQAFAPLLAQQVATATPASPQDPPLFRTPIITATPGGASLPQPTNTSVPTVAAIIPTVPPVLPIEPARLIEDTVLLTDRLLAPQLPPAEFTRKADVIIEVTVRDIGQGRWNTPDALPPVSVERRDVPFKTAIYTPITMDINRVFKNMSAVLLSDRAQFTFFHLGGTVGRVTVRVTPTYNFRPGETLLLFLSSKDAQFMRTPGGLYLADAYLYIGSEDALSLYYQTRTNRSNLINEVQNAATP